MNTHDIELPQGHAERPFDYWGELYTEGQVRAIIEADRKHRGEPVACFKCGHAKHSGECVNVAYHNGWMVPEGWKLVPIEPTYELVCGVGGERMDEESFLHEYADHKKIGEICRAVVKYSPPPPKAPDYNPGPLEVSVVGMPEFDALLDHIYEEGTRGGDVIHLTNKLVRAAIQSHISYARNAQPVAYKWGGVVIRSEETHPIHRKEGQPLYATPIAAVEADRQARGDPVGWEYLYGGDWIRTTEPETHKKMGREVRPLYTAPQPAEPVATQPNGQAQQDAEPDMYWDADDPERFGAMDLHGAVEYMMDSYTISDLPMTLSLLCARSMPNVEVRVTGYTDDDGWQYEVIDAARKDEGGEK